ncbi:MAG: 4Fe-4S dicluster domain-containing protein [Anaerolineales bacterium]|nr:MAG: 4Fe-4S dicluster domain-containing protein [Anaerolineales bacterium]
MARGSVIIDVDRCKGCGLCVNVCPPKILSLTQDRFNAKGYYPVTVANPEYCTGCGSCVLICPDAVFTVYRTLRQRVPAGADGG